MELAARKANESIKRTTRGRRLLKTHGVSGVLYSWSVVSSHQSLQTGGRFFACFVPTLILIFTSLACKATSPCIPEVYTLHIPYNLNLAPISTINLKKVGLFGGKNVSKTHYTDHISLAFFFIDASYICKRMQVMR